MKTAGLPDAGAAKGGGQLPALLTPRASLKKEPLHRKRCLRLRGAL